MSMELFYHLSFGNKTYAQDEKSEHKRRETLRLIVRL